MSHHKLLQSLQPPTPKKSKLSDEVVYIPEYWANLETYLNKMGSTSRKYRVMVSASSPSSLLA